MPIDPDECSMCSNVLSLHACRSKYISGAQNCAVTRRLSLQMQLRYTKMHSGLTPVSPNDCFTCSNVLSLDTCRSKRIATPEIHLPRFVTFLFVDLHPFGTFGFVPNGPPGHQKCAFWMLSWRRASSKVLVLSSEELGYCRGAEPTPTPPTLCVRV